MTSIDVRTIMNQGLNRTGYTGSSGGGYTGSVGADGVGSIGPTGFTGSASSAIGPTGFTGSGGAGFTGSEGIQGTTGMDGVVGIASSFDTGTSAPSGSGLATGTFRFNSISNPTTLWLQTSDVFTNATLKTWIQQFGLSTTPNNKGQIIARNTASSTNPCEIVFTITGAISFGGTSGEYASIPVTTNAVNPGITSFTPGDVFSFEFSRTGDQGTIGFTGSVGIGFTGSSGAGFTGSLGFSGSIGSIGPTGFVGSLGPTGFTGSGASGFTGSLGPTGFTGSVGPGGTGSIGPTG